MPLCIASSASRGITGLPRVLLGTLLMSTGLTFGTISALFGLSHQIISQSQYSSLVAVVIASAVVPTLIANAVFLPYHLLPRQLEEAAPSLMQTDRGGST